MRIESNLEWQPKPRIIWKVETRRHYSNHPMCLPVKHHRLSHDAEIGAEPLTPKPIAEEDDPLGGYPLGRPLTESEALTEPSPASV